jgi:hypothetical protein
MKQFVNGHKTHAFSLGVTFLLSQAETTELVSWLAALMLFPLPLP